MLADCTRAGAADESCPVITWPAAGVHMRVKELLTPLQVRFLDAGHIWQ